MTSTKEFVKYVGTELRKWGFRNMGGYRVAVLNWNSLGEGYQDLPKGYNHESDEIALIEAVRHGEPKRLIKHISVRNN